MPILLLFFFFIFTFLILHRNKKCLQHFNNRETFLLTAITSGTLICIGSEFLSFFDLLTSAYVCGFWTMLTIGALLFWVKDYRKQKIYQPPFHFPRLIKSEAALLLGVGFILSASAVIAFVAPPNTWDSMTYHMPRVTHWIQNQSLNNYPTAVLRQLYYCPFAEMIILHFQMLCGSDRFANMAQWLSMIGSLAGISLIVKYFGGNARAQILAVLFAATLPLGILESTSAQNDYVASFWLICFVYFLLIIKIRPGRVNMLAAGISLGLAFLTKGFSYIYAFPFLLWLAGGWIKFRQFKNLKLLAGILVVAFMLNSGYYYRNFTLTKSILPPTKNENIMADWNHPAAPMANLVYYTTLQLKTPFKAINQTIEKWARAVGEFFYKPAQNSNGQEHIFYFTTNPFHEDNAGNPLHFILIFFGLIALFYTRRLRNLRQMSGYAVSIAAGFIILGLLSSWAPWNNRYHLPFFLLSAPLAGILLGKIKYLKLTLSIAIILFFSALPWLFCNESRPLLAKKNIFNTSRTEQYFSNQKGFYYSYIAAASSVKKIECSRIGLLLGEDSWEYPLRAILSNKKSAPCRIEHVNVENASSTLAYPRGGFSPCAILSDNANLPAIMLIDKQRYIRVRRLPFLDVFFAVIPENFPAAFGN